ncbi:MAG: hypothetical protein CL693_16830 [Cellvibrionaceae bacterium]|nr:hypothetical protein [Cellvibrionaceae bacterium]|tara:strand:- start:2526 stop:3332 length:807 start_codon:yes stop_codon:yes gene_type:complete
MGLRCSSASVSHVGHAREVNEDTHLADDAQGLWIVADGVGGHVGGDVASRLAVDTVSQQVAEGADLTDAFLQAHERILERAQTLDLAGMGTTLAAVRQTGRLFELAWVGDSRIYCFEEPRRGDEQGRGLNQSNRHAAQIKLQQLSRDHSFVEDMVERGVLSRDEAATHPQRNLIRQALGMPKSIKVDRLQFKPRVNGLLLVCSDGVTDMLSDAQLAALLDRYLDRHIKALALELKNALLATPADDNFTFILIAYSPGRVNAWLNRCLP